MTSLNDGVQSIATNMKTLVSGTQSVSDGAAPVKYRRGNIDRNVEQDGN
ncbi:MAG: hypothetical protein ACLU6P_07265 [Roseburia intestinalis]